MMYVLVYWSALWRYERRCFKLDFWWLYESLCFKLDFCKHRDRCVLTTSLLAGMG